MLQIIYKKGPLVVPWIRWNIADCYLLLISIIAMILQTKIPLEKVCYDLTTKLYREEIAGYVKSVDPWSLRLLWKNMCKVV